MPTKNKPTLLDNLLLAISFLTIIPVPDFYQKRSVKLTEAMIFFPLIGFLIGIISLCLIKPFEPIFSERLICLLLVLSPIVLSGGLHIDGLADFFDAFFQGRNKEDILRVMKDSRIGVWGALSVIFLIFLKWELLIIMPQRNIVFLVALSISRWAHTWISFLLPYARSESGLGQSVAGLLSKQQLRLSTVSAIIISLLLGIKGLVVVAISALFIWLLSRFYKARIGGVTGDVIGATGEMAELFVYVLMVLL